MTEEVNSEKVWTGLDPGNKEEFALETSDLKNKLRWQKVIGNDSLQKLTSDDDYGP